MTSSRISQIGEETHTAVVNKVLIKPTDQQNLKVNRHICIKKWQKSRFKRENIWSKGWSDQLRWRFRASIQYNFKYKWVWIWWKELQRRNGVPTFASRSEFPVLGLFDPGDDDYILNIQAWQQSEGRGGLILYNSPCFTGFTVKAYRVSLSLSLSFMRSHKSPEVQLPLRISAQSPSDTNWCFTETNCREQQGLSGAAPTSGEDENRGEEREKERVQQEG